MKHFILLFSLLAVVSCNGKTDLESFKFDQKIPDNSMKGEKATEATYGLLSYKQTDIKNYTLGAVSFSEHAVPKGYDYSNNNLALFVNSYQKNQYLGFILNLVQEEQGERLVDFITKTYGYPEKRTTNKTGIAYFWDASAKNKWLFLTQTKELARDNTIYTNTKLLVVKNGTKVENALDPSTFSILDSFTLAYPK